ncbi:MAG: hypothetical protein IT517_08190 [Burkholderiales bacterium]|nr:hypothetical protein [Burkholderiales bacterium]
MPAPLELLRDPATPMMPAVPVARVAAGRPLHGRRLLRVLDVQSVRDDSRPSAPQKCNVSAKGTGHERAL